MVITQSGKPVYRIESEHQAQLKDETIALLKLMNIAERDIRSWKNDVTQEAKLAPKKKTRERQKILGQVVMTQLGFESLYMLERYMSEYLSDPEALSEQLIDISEAKLKFPLGPVCPELEYIGVTDYFSLPLSKITRSFIDTMPQQTPHLSRRLCVQSKARKSYWCAMRC